MRRTLFTPQTRRCHAIFLTPYTRCVFLQSAPPAVCFRPLTPLPRDTVSCPPDTHLKRTHRTQNIHLCGTHTHTHATSPFRFVSFSLPFLLQLSLNSCTGHGTAIAQRESENESAPHPNLEAAAKAGNHRAHDHRGPATRERKRTERMRGGWRACAGVLSRCCTVSSMVADTCRGELSGYQLHKRTTTAVYT